MTIHQITNEELLKMCREKKEGLVLMGCGGDLTEWVNGVNDMLTDEKILLDGTRFENCRVFQYGDITCLLFPFGETHLDIGKFAMWRIATHGTFNGKWLSDFIVNQLGYSEEETNGVSLPKCPIIGADGNIFNILGIASKTLRKHGMETEAREMAKRVYASKSYYEALGIIQEYVEPVSVDENLDNDAVFNENTEQDEGDGDPTFKQ